MNKRGNIFLGFGIAIFLWIMGIQLIPFIVSVIDSTRVDLSCSTTTISFGTKLICLMHDLTIPIIIWTLVCLILGLIMGKGT